MAKYLVAYPIEIVHRQVVMLPRGSEILDVEISANGTKSKKAADVSLVVIAEQEGDYIRRDRNLESRTILTYSLGSMIERKRESINLIGMYSINWGVKKSFCVFEQVKKN
jgi:hypothetical protein